MKLLRRTYQLSQEQVDLIKTTCCKGASDEELRLFLWVAKRHRLDPLTRQLHAVKRHVTKHHTDDKGIWVSGDQMTIQIGIDGYRAMAARYKDYGAVDEPEYEFAEAKDKIPVMARVKLWKKGLEHPTVGVAYWDEYAPADLTANTAFMWKKMPKLMLAKCAEALALRKAYPDLADIYTDEEMHQADVDYTPGGRQIVTADGTAPSGRVVDEYKHGQLAVAAEVDRQLAEHKAVVERQTAAKEASTTPKPAEIVAPEPSQAQPTGKKASLGVVEVDWTGHPGAPIVRGAIENLLPMIQKHCTATWAKDEWWHVLGTDVPTIKKMCAELEFEFREILPARSSGGAAMTSPEKPTAKGRAQSPSAAPAVVSGTIERVNSGMAGKAPVKYVTLILADKSKPCFGCFHKSLFDELEKGVGKLATFIVLTKGQYTNIEGLRKIGSKEWDADGLPVIQNAQREAGGRTLFP